MAICSWITIPIFTIPFTLQTFALFFAFDFLGDTKGLISLVVYLALGAIGVPVFSGFAGGAGHLLGPTGGYLVGFVLSGAVIIVFDHIKKNKLTKIASNSLALLICYLFGSVWFSVSTGSGFVGTITICVLPFIIPDIAKITFAILISSRLKKIPGLKLQ